MACSGDDSDVAKRLAFAVELATRKVQLDGFEGLVAADCG